MREQPKQRAKDGVCVVSKEKQRGQGGLSGKGQSSRRVRTLVIMLKEEAIRGF